MLCVLIAHNIEWRDTLSISVTEAGRRGGRVIRERYGIKHYQQIGKKGGKTFLEQRGPLFFSAIGTKGGKTRKQQVDPDFYSRIGRLGGSAHATWHRLLPYFQLSSRVTEGKQAVWVELRPFNDRQLNRDLRVVCERVAAAQPHLPDRRRLCLTIAGTGCLSSDGQKRKMA